MVKRYAMQQGFKQIGSSRIHKPSEMVAHKDGPYTSIGDYEVLHQEVVDHRTVIEQLERECDELKATVEKFCNIALDESIDEIERDIAMTEYAEQLRVSDELL